MAATDALSESLEDYLEAIFHIVARKHAARAKDISDRLNVSSSSVTGALHALADRELVNYAPYDVITLTPEGHRLAEDIVRRHDVLHAFFVKVLAVDEDEAETAACKMEHAVPRSILERFLEFLEFIETCPRAGFTWVQGFGCHCRESMDKAECVRCVQRVLDEVRGPEDTPGAPADG
jgi:DtxR family transcriptional regulator, Mn-dependent transcriptional regulator